MIDINNRIQIQKILSQLDKNQLPSFGIMSPQHMVEHLILSVMLSNGKMSSKLYFSEEKAQMIKSKIIYTDAQLPIGFKAPMLEDKILDLKFPNLEMAKDKLYQELDKFNEFFTHNPNAKPINPSMGTLNHKEWVVFHNKHFSHHFKQFQLI